MIRDLRFDEIERADKRKRLVRLVVACLLVSTAGSYLVSREMKIRDEHRALPEAKVGDPASFTARHDALQGMLSKYHIWAGAFSARDELDALMVSIHEQETAHAKVEAKRIASETLIREEAEAARIRGYVFVERREFELALEQLRRSLELIDSLGEASFEGGEWEHRSKVELDVSEIHTMLSEGGAR